MSLQNIEEKRKLFANLISISKAFAEKSGLLTDQQVIQTIKEIESRGGHASMIMLGNGVLSDILFPGSIPFLISSAGARLL
jgi:pantoate kinase